jgi:GAF domain-containing protein
MATLPENMSDAIDELETAIAEMESRLESARAERDEAMGRQVELEIENANLRRELVLARERHEASAEILTAIANTDGDAEHALQQIAETAQHFFDASSVTIRITDGKEWIRTIRVGRGSERVLAAVPASELAVHGKNVAGLVYRENRQIHVPDIDHVDASIADFPGWAPARAGGSRTVSGTPLRLGSDVIGAMIIHRDRLAAFTDEELALQQSFADQAVIAIENARLFNETKESLERQTTTADILKVIASSPSNVQPVFEAVVGSAARLFEPCAVTIVTLKDERVHWGATAASISGFDVEQARTIYPLPFDPERVPSARAMLERRIVEIPDVDAPGVSETTRKVAAAGGFRSMTFVPLLDGERGIGTIVFTSPQTGFRFAERQLALIKTFADQAVIAIQNTRQFNETREALERQTATADILKVIAASPSDVQPVFQAIADSAKQLLGGFSATVLHFIGDELHLVAFTPTNPAADDGLQSSFPRRVTELPIFELVRDGATIQFPDTEADNVPATNRDLGRLRGFRSVLFVPLMNRGKAVGILSVTRTKPGAFAEHHMQLLQTFADQAVIAIENARLFNETQEALERQTATADILKVIASSPSDVKPVFDAIAASANRLIGGYSTAVFRLIDDVVHMVAFTPTTPEADAALQTIFPLPRAEVPSLVLVEKGETAQIADSETSDPQSARIARARGWRSALFTPLMNKGAVIGFITVTRREIGSFADHHVKLLRTFADQAVIAIENVRLFNETMEALKRQTATADILKVIASSPSDVQPVFDTIVHSANRLIGGFSTAVFRYGDGKIHLAAFTPTDTEGDAVLQSSFPVPLEQFPPYHLTLNGAPAELPDTETEPAARDIARSRGYRSMLFAPLMNEGAAVGIITVTRVAPGPFGEQHTRLLQMFADQAVIAIRNVGLFDEVQQRTEDLSEALQQQTATADVLKVISRSAFDLETVLDALLSSACRLCEADIGTVRYREGPEYRLAATFGCKPEWIEHFRRYSTKPDRSSVFGRTIVEGHAVHIPDLLADPDYNRPQAQMLMGFRAALGVPLMREGEAFGVINLFRLEVSSFSDRQIELVQTFADQAVIAIENVRLFDEVQAKTRDLSEALTYQTGSANILKVIASSPTNVEPALKAIVESACELCEAYDAVLVLKDGGDLRFSAHHGPIPMTVEKWPINRRWTAGRAFVDRKPVHVHDLLAEGDEFPDGRELSQRMGHRTILSVPLLREGESIGTIVLRRTEVNPFTDKQIALLQTFADQAVIAIGNVRLFEEVQARTRDLSEALTHQTGSANILRVIASSPTDVEPVLESIVESACELCEANDAHVALKDGDDLVFKAQHGSIPIVWDRIPINRRMVTGRAVIDGTPIHIGDLNGPDGDEFPDAREFARRTNVRSLLSVPLQREGSSIGVITLRRQEVNPFTDKQIALLQTFADQAVIAIGNVRLFEQVQERTRELSQSLDDLRTAQDRLVQTEKLASLGQLTAGIAHEIKNPLNFVNNFAALSAELTEELKDVLKPAGIGDKMRSEVDELTSLLKDNLEKVVQHGKRADSIVKNMLLHSREGGGEHRPSDINALVDEALNLAYHGARAEKPDFNVTLERDFDPAAGQIDLFPQEITRVFLNLVSNGFYAVTKRRKEGGEPGFEPTVRTSTKNLGASVEIRIRDNGTGIPPEVKEKMFNPFFTTKPAGEGTGLGLSMSHDIIVKQHGGTIDADTEQGQFTEFRIVLPRTSNFER